MFKSGINRLVLASVYSMELENRNVVALPV